MEHPQTLAIELYKNGFELPHLKEISETGCCAFVFLWCLGIEGTDAEAIKTVSDAITAGVIEPDCTVKWWEFGKWLTGRNIDVEKVSIKDLFGIQSKTPVLYQYKGQPHFVGVKNGMISFNPLTHSNIVEHGNPISKRVIVVKGIAK